MDLYEVGRITGIILFVYLVTGIIPDLFKKWVFRNKITIDIGKKRKAKSICIYRQRRQLRSI